MNNRHERLNQILALIPENPENEALLSIQTIVKYPFTLKLQLSCHLSTKFIVFIAADKVGNGLTLSAYNWKAEPRCTDTTLLSTLKRIIFEIDAAIVEGQFVQKRPKIKEIIPDYPAPSNMDIPVWDNERKRWYDAEY